MTFVVGPIRVWGRSRYGVGEADSEAFPSRVPTPSRLH
jgi:hypothetical protein